MPFPPIFAPHAAEERLKTPSSYIEIKGSGVVSPFDFKNALGESPRHALSTVHLDGSLTSVGMLAAPNEEKLRALVADNPLLRQVDRSVLLAVHAARLAIRQAGWSATEPGEVAINIGSSRGATASFEKYFESYQASPDRSVSSQASPVTTLGNISSWVAQDLQTEGPLISHSITCSTTLQAIANAMAWLRSGMASHFLAGGAEAPLTSFTVAQMKAIGIYTPVPEHPYPCRPCNRERKNSFVLGEGAAVFALALTPAKELKKTKEADRVIIEAVGFGFEQIQSKTGISADGRHFRKAMEQAMGSARSSLPPDVIMLHAPGTVAGDAAELNAVQAVFGNNTPYLYSNKWQIGHTLGASAALSVEQAIQILRQQQVPEFPYAVSFINKKPQASINRIMINAAGFGGNAAALIVSRVG